MRKNVLLPERIANATSMGADITTADTTISYTDVVGYHLTWTGTPTGVFEVQATVNGTDWQALSLSPTPQATGAAGGTLISLNQIPYNKVRVFYDRTSGTGNLTVWIMTKQLGG